jgi:hypothetical protein
MKSIILLLAIIGIIIVCSGYIQNNLQCPPPIVQYRYIEKTFQQEQDTQQPLFGSFKTVTASVDKNVEIAGSAVVYLAAATVLSLGVLNTTSRSYVGNSYTNDDKIRFSITQIRL